MEIFLSNPIIGGFLNNFSQDQRIPALHFVSLIGIEYIANFSNDSSDLFQTLKSIASNNLFMAQCLYCF